MAGRMAPLPNVLRLALLCCTAAMAQQQPTTIAVAAFNVQVFGQSKISKQVSAGQSMASVLSDIIQRFDLLFVGVLLAAAALLLRSKRNPTRGISVSPRDAVSRAWCAAFSLVFLVRAQFQEIRDSSGNAISTLFDAVNDAGPRRFGMSLSPRLGRSTSKEQYALFFDRDKVSVREAFVYDSVGADRFERPPYALLVEHLATDTVFVVLGCHVAPSDAASEVDALADAYDGVVKRWGVQDALILGDFNADCSYLPESTRRCSTDRYCTTRAAQPLRLYAEQDRFTWLVGDDVDTTVKDTDCTYDRIVGAGALRRADVAATRRWRLAEGDGASAFRFDEALGLSQPEAELVSDHWPVRVMIATDAPPRSAVPDDLGAGAPCAPGYTWAGTANTTCVCCLVEDGGNATADDTPNTTCVCCLVEDGGNATADDTPSGEERAPTPACQEEGAAVGWVTLAAAAGGALVLGVAVGAACRCRLCAPSASGGEEKTRSANPYPGGTLAVRSGRSFKAAVKGYRSRRSGSTLGTASSGVALTTPKSTTKKALPEEWEAHTDPNTGEEYFFSTVSGESTWERPSSGGASSNRKSTLPNGWKELEAPDRQIYFVDSATGESQWERPERAAPPVPKEQTHRIRSMRLQ